MVDPLDEMDQASEEATSPLPPLPPGIAPPPPLPDLPPPDFNPPPPESTSPQFGFTPDSASDGDLLDAANSLPTTNNPSQNDAPTDFKSVWESRKASDPSISQTTRDSIYSRIDRISSGKGDSLMDRYADRFGSDLDREIIVLRKKDQDDLTSIMPKVELISSSSKNEMSLSEFMEAMNDEDFLLRVSEKTGVSVDKIDELDLAAMEEFFIKSDTDNSGTLDFDEFVKGIIDSFRSRDEDFSHFFTVVDGLLGELPEEKVNSFIKSDDFEMFKSIGEEPKSSQRQTRSDFFKMVNELLADLPDQVMEQFTSSQDFELYKTIADRYGD